MEEYIKKVTGTIIPNETTAGSRKHGKKLSVIEQIEHMKNESGIKFNIVKEEEAQKYLSDNTYYFKLKAYTKNYSKYASGENTGKYCNLEFAYLQELSRIDTNLRKYILGMAIDIEHFLKVQMLKHCAENPDEDGYNIVECFFRNRDANFIKELKKKCENSNCKHLFESKCDHFALWNIVEILSFGDFIDLYELYYSHYSDKKCMKNNLKPVKFLRNAAAHNNCLINHLDNKYALGITPNQKVNHFVSQIDGISKATRQKKMENNIIHDFVVMLYVFNHIVSSENIRSNTMKDLNDLFCTKLTMNSKYFEDNMLIVTNYNFVKKIVGYFASNDVKSYL